MAIPRQWRHVSGPSDPRKHDIDAHSMPGRIIEITFLDLPYSLPHTR